ncbi:MAG: outer membrane lipoprotein carrier protein LolA [Tannerella sp.]|nr:outer membrane lipoprotein carrier protein LolA [Tannerella sp.]
MRKIMFVISGMLLCVTTFAQSSYQTATEAQQKEIIDKITAASQAMKTMNCDFTQVKELSFMDDKVVSEGKMFYKQPNKIRWEYTKPKAYVFAMDGKNVFMDAGNSQTTVPAKSSKMFSSISDIIIGGVSGSGLINSPDFTAQFGVGANDYRVTLVPVKKEVKDLFDKIQIFVNKTDSRIQKVELIEKGGDKTEIQLKNLQTNAAINDEIFSRK